MTDRSESVKEVLDLLSDWKRIWSLSDYNSKNGHAQNWMTVDAYATRYGLVILHRYYTGATLEGWDIYTTLANTNKVDVTVNALKRFLNGED